MQTANGKNGSKWIRKDKRLAVYLRDGLACAFCGGTIEDGCVLTLDHLVPRSQGGTHNEKNLVTCCRRCNSARGDRDLVAFAASVAEYLDHGVTAASILAHIENCIRRPLGPFRAEAKELIARRGSYAAALGA